MKPRKPDYSGEIALVSLWFFVCKTIVKTISIDDFCLSNKMPFVQYLMVVIKPILLFVIRFYL